MRFWSSFLLATAVTARSTHDDDGSVDSSPPRNDNDNNNDTTIDLDVDGPLTGDHLNGLKGAITLFVMRILGSGTSSKRRLCS